MNTAKPSNMERSQRIPAPFPVPGGRATLRRWIFESTLLRLWAILSLEPSLLALPPGNTRKIQLIRDADGLRVAQVITLQDPQTGVMRHETNRWLWDSLPPMGAPQVIATLSDAGLQRQIVQGLGPVAETLHNSAGTESRRYWLNDGHGSIRGEVSEELSVELLNPHDAFGNPLDRPKESFPEDADLPYRFSGEWFDIDLDQYEIRQRIYAPTLGRWTTRDPFHGDLEHPVTRHPYGYTRQDPINRADPSGAQDYNLSSLLTTAALSGGIATLDTHIATRGRASGRQLAESFVIGAFSGAAGFSIGPIFRAAGAGGRLALNGFALAGGFASVADAVRERNSPLAAFRALSFTITHSLSDPENAVRIYRVKGDSKTRVVVTDAGEVTLEGSRTLFLNLGSEVRAEDYLSRSSARGGSVGRGESLEIEPEYLHRLREQAVPGESSKKAPDRPIRLGVGPGQPANGILDQDFDALLHALDRNESGEVR